MVNIKVAVRIRPFSHREVNQKDESIVQTCDKSILVTNLKVPETSNGDSRQRIRRFAVDYCYDPAYPETCTQESVYQDVGREVLDSMFDGYNACVLAYGHSASGKTYTMMGDEDDPGLTPRICQGLFRRMNEKAINANVKFHTVISFLEIYNERVRDLLVSDDSGANAGGNFSLRVREHPKLGPYVQDLSQHTVNDESRILEYLAIGNSRRSTAATENNIHSSRSHAVFTIRFRQCDEQRYESERSSKVHLVDLAGSERAGSTQSKTRLKEGANINKSLVTLGNVISALAESCETFTSPKEQPITKTWQPFVPYRDSVLTWLLKDTLGGNSNTIMIATVSPASSCLNETINTLRYAKRTKRIVNQPIVNEDPKIRTIRELREEIEKLRHVILTLQINNRNCLEDDISTSKSKEENENENVREGDFEESIDNQGDNVNGNIPDVETDAICGLDILPNLSAGNEGNNAENHTGNHRIGIRAPSANSFSVDVSKINDEKKTDVNGSVIDKLAHESQVFSGSLESLPVLRTKQADHGDICVIDSADICGVPYNFSKCADGKSKKKRQNTSKTNRDNQFVPKISRTSKLRICSRKQAKHRLKLYLKREYDSLENLNLPKMLHRSRPDLIKGIAAHSKDGLPSTSSQSFTDVSGLSQSTSENSLNSSGSVDSQTSENKSVKCWPAKTKPLEENKSRMKYGDAMEKSTSRQSSIGDGSGSSTPTQISKPVAKRRADKRSEIVAAVTTRLYATKKKPDPRLEALQAAEKEDDDGELQELKLCKRARMKLFDLSRKLAMAKRNKKTADSDTQTDFATGTVRVKEKCVLTDQSGVVQYESSSTNTPSERPLKKEKEQPIIMNQVFIPRFSNYVVECGRNVRVEVPARPKNESGTQTVTIYKDQSTSPPAQTPNEENFSDDSLEDEELATWKKDYEIDSLETSAETSMRNKSGMKSQSNENIFRKNVTKTTEPISFIRRRSYDSLLDAKTTIDRSWLPITRYPIAGTNALFEYDPNKSTPDVVYNNTGDTPKTQSQDIYPRKTCPTDEPSGSKIRRTEIVFPMFNGLPLAICTETTSNNDSIADDTINFITSNINRFLPGNLQNDENNSSENSLASNEGSDVTTSSETSSEDFVFYEGPRPKETLSRQSGLGNLYTISENSELSDLTTSDPSSPQPSQHSSLQFLDHKRDKKIFPPFVGNTTQNCQTEDEKSTGKELMIGDEPITIEGRVKNKDYTVGVHVLRNPWLSDAELAEKINKPHCSLEDRNHNRATGKYFHDGFSVHLQNSENEIFRCGLLPDSQNDRENLFYAAQQDIPANKLETSSRESESHSNGTQITVMNSPNSGLQKQPEPFQNGETSVKTDNDNKPQQKQKKIHPEKQGKKINWSDLQSSSQKQFLNFNILGSSKQTPFSIDSNMFGEKKQTSDAKFPSEDSITFVFMGPNRQKTSMLMEIIKRTLGQGSSSDASFGEKSQKKSRNRGVQCKLMRSVSVDTAMIALSRFAKHQRPTLDITRTSSLDTLVPEEMQTILEQGRLHGIRENGCQCDLGQITSECQCRKTKPQIIKYTICTTTTRDQGTETEKSLDMTDKCSMTSSLVDASCDALEESDENLFGEYFPPLPRTKLTECQSSKSRWKDMKDVILGTSEYLRSDEDDEDKPKRARKGKKSVSWSDLSECNDNVDEKTNQETTDNTDETYPMKLEEYCLTGTDNSVKSPEYNQPTLDYTTQTRRVRFSEPQQSCVDDYCHVLHEKKEAVKTAANVTAFLQEAVQLLRNLNHLSQIYDAGEASKRAANDTTKTDNESWQEMPKSSLKRVETSVQTDGQTAARPKDISLSAESSPIRRVRTSCALSERRDRKGSLNLTWPRPRPTSTALGKPPTGLKYPLKPSRSPLSSRPPSALSSYDLKNDLESSSTSTNWNISNLSTTFSNSYFGDSVCSRPTSSKSFYSDGVRSERLTETPSKYYNWSRSNSKILSPRPPKPNDLELDLEDSCRRLEIAVERDRIREENSALRLSYLNSEKYTPTKWDCEPESRSDPEINKTKKAGKVENFKCNAEKHSPIFRQRKSFERKINHTRKKPCKCYCHYRNINKVYRSSLELEAQPPDKHCHTCCTPCEAGEPELSNSTPALNSICDSENCRLLYYGYCPCSPVKLQHVKSSPRAYMQHLLSLRRKIVKNTYGNQNST